MQSHLQGMYDRMALYQRSIDFAFSNDRLVLTPFQKKQLNKMNQGLDSIMITIETLLKDPGHGQTTIDKLLNDILKDDL